MNVVVEVEEIEEGYTVEIVKTKIIEGVTLEVFDNREATLYIGNNPVEFDWSLEMAYVFENIDIIEPIELLALLAQVHVIES